ncbi:MAG: Maf family protein [Armatimonadota bacterium]|nr:Maf family protein [Armatimonadota bacterium]MDR7449066.1 Maf family protein [Armatimonadota bacterium]MDR7459146.1 Maf family protein [Armatimonadota bacterium]MDR7480418.1 Maf family protein [Armatimonadota bacterium]MDR7489365.1 Maf family protein [Armatimonadota bacterium]
MSAVTSSPLVLASSSPRRAELLRLLGLAFTVHPVGDEAASPAAEAPDAPVGPAEAGGREAGSCRDAPGAAALRARRLARAKAEAAAPHYPGAVVIGADTIVVVDGRALGKPRDAAEAAAMLRQLGGRTHHVATGIAVVRADRDLRLDAVTLTAVTFRPLSEDEIAAYVATGEPFDKAGGYGIQGRAAIFVERIEGDYYGVVGLPLAPLALLLRRAGVRVL